MKETAPPKNVGELTNCYYSRFIISKAKTKTRTKKTHVDTSNFSAEEGTRRVSQPVGRIACIRFRVTFQIFTNVQGEV